MFLRWLNFFLSVNVIGKWFDLKVYGNIVMFLIRDLKLVNIRFKMLLVIEDELDVWVIK